MIHSQEVAEIIQLRRTVEKLVVALKSLRGMKHPRIPSSLEDLKRDLVIVEAEQVLGFNVKVATEDEGGN